jgi:Ion channel
MWILAAAGSLALILLLLVDAFEAIILPRRVTHRYRLAVLFYRGSWKLWRRLARGLPAGRRREAFLSLFGPLWLLLLFGMWMFGLILGFALLHWSLGTPLRTSADEETTFLTYFYLSGTTFSTLGFGDIVAVAALGRLLTVVEAALGFGFLACIIGYLPVFYQAFSRREVTISLLDARAGSPPSAAQLLLRLARSRNVPAVVPILAEWERWAAEVLESHLSYPVLSFYRSQHDNQSWLAALTMMLDTCAVIVAGVKDLDPYHAQLTFAMARHAAVDLALVFQTPPQIPTADRLPPERLARLRELLHEAGMDLRAGAAADAKLVELRAMYEPFVQGLGDYFLFGLPPVLPEGATVDNWQTSAWLRRAPAFSHLAVRDPGDEHFD